MARPSLWTHRKFTRLCRLLGAKYRAAGVLEVVWASAYQDGDARIGTADDVEYLCGWDGPPGVCAAAMVDAEFLDRDDDGMLTVHDLEDHAPDYVRRRAVRERQRQDNGGRMRTVTGQRPVSDRAVTPTPAPAPAPAPIEQTNVQPSAKKEVADSFVRWYALYQRHEARKDAETAWRNLSAKERAECEQMTAAWFTARPNMERKFIPLPATFLRARRWTDDPPPVETPKPAVKTGPEKTPTFYRAEDRREWQKAKENEEHSAELRAIVQRALDAGKCFSPGCDADACQRCWETVPQLREKYVTRANCRKMTRKDGEA